MRNGRTITIGLAVLAAMPLLYIGAYVASVHRIDDPPWPPLVVYVVGGPVAEKVFWPIHALDRELRPDYWGRRRLADPYYREVFYP